MNQKLQSQEEKGEKAFRFGGLFGRKHVGENTETIAALAPTESEHKDARIAELQEAVRKRARNLRHGTIACWISALSTPLLAASLLGLTSLETSNFYSHTDLSFQIAGYAALMEAGMGISVAASVLGAASMFRGIRRLKRATTAVADTEDMRAVGPFTEALRSANTTVQVTAAIALNRLLPRLRPGDFDLLDHKQRTCLYRALRASANPRSLQSYNPEFAVTVVRTLEHIGDARALPIVERLAKSAKDAHVRAAAAECLSALKLRLEANPAGVLRADSEEEREARLESAPVPERSVSIETLMRQLQEAAQTRKRDYPIGIAGIVLGLIMIIAGLAIESAQQGSRISGFGFLPGEVVIVASMLFLRYGASRTRGATSALSITEDLRVVGPLAAALEMGDAWTQAMAAQALTRLLPRLQASDTDLLNDEQCTCLCHRLDHIGKHKINGQDADFAVSVLKALEQVGDGKSLPTVVALTKIKVRTSTDGRVRDAAMSCLPFLQERAEQQRAEETLLRAASPSEAPPEALLRPAAGTPVADTELLLRPGALPDETDRSV